MTAASDPVEFQQEFFRRNPNALSMMELMEFLPRVAFYAKDTESRFVKVNSVLLENKGLSDERQALGKTDRAFFPPALAEAYIAEDKRVMAGRKAIPNQMWLVPRGRGTPRWFVSSKTPLIDEAGAVIGVCGVMYPVDTPQDQQRHFRELVPVIRYISDHYTTPVSMKEMAALAGLSATHFNRRFRALLRMSPTEYLLTLRVQEAQRLLTESSMSMSEIALEAGFSDQSHFTKRFKRVTGMTPLAYRKRFRSVQG